ncbi:hypothetical protein Holit_00682 [Hollandina sp. SP2]
MPQKYNQVTIEEREETAIFLNAGMPLSQIAEKLERDKRTISREIRRNNARYRKVYQSGPETNR